MAVGSATNPPSRVGSCRDTGGRSRRAATCSNCSRGWAGRACPPAVPAAANPRSRGLPPLAGPGGGRLRHGCARWDVGPRGRVPGSDPEHTPPAGERVNRSGGRPALDWPTWPTLPCRASTLVRGGHHRAGRTLGRNSSRAELSRRTYRASALNTFRPWAGGVGTRCRGIPRRRGSRVSASWESSRGKRRAAGRSRRGGALTSRRVPRGRRCRLHPARKVLVQPAHCPLRSAFRHWGIRSERPIRTARARGARGGLGHPATTIKEPTIRPR